MNIYCNYNWPFGYNWPGWPLENNPYGDEFDLEARKRMVKGSGLLFPLIKKYQSRLGTVIIEIGPFFNPLITPKKFSNKIIFYLEKDFHAVNWLSKEYRSNKVFPINFDLNRITKKSLVNITLKFFKKVGYQKVIFDSLVASQIFNYINYKHFLMVIKPFLSKNALIFVNNPINYGLPSLFSAKRPKNINEILNFLREIKFRIIKKEIHTFSHKRKRYKRVLIVAKKT